MISPDRSRLSLREARMSTRVRVASSMVSVAIATAITAVIHISVITPAVGTTRS